MEMIEEQIEKETTDQLASKGFGGGEGIGRGRDSAVAAASFFAAIPRAPELEQFHKNALYAGDPFEMKVNLTIGAYRDDSGQPFVFPVVQRAKMQLLQQLEEEDGGLIDEQEFGPFGYRPFIQSTIELLLGNESTALTENRTLGIQCLSGTGALRLGGEFLSQVLGLRRILLSDPTWNGHRCIFQSAGFQDIRHYRYYDPENRRLDFEGMLQDLREARERDVILLQACAHNPTGLDLNKAQWKQVADVVQERRLLPFFDVAYSGFASGDPAADAWPIRHFAGRRIQMLVMQSFAKNFGLYNERIGALTIVLAESASVHQQLAAIRSRLEPLVRGLWANPPLFGARIVHAILSEPQLREEWLQTLKQMHQRLVVVRQLLRIQMEQLGVPGCWEHLTGQTGFFSYTGLTAAQVHFLQRKFHLYMLDDGRINICGLNPQNVQYVAQAFGAAIQHGK